MRAPADIDSEEYDSLNEAFYRANPAGVIDARLWMLVRYLGDEDLEVSEAGEGIAFGRDDVPDLEARIQFASLEAMLIEHQAAETLLRLLLAHWGDAPCPWWELTRLRAPREFPSRVSRLAKSLNEEETQAEILRLVSWTGDKETLEKGVTWKHEDGWTRHQQGLRNLIAHCCDVVTTQADLYNAGKHGLAILPEKMGVELGDGEVISVSGPSLTVIERGTIDNEPRWLRVTHWVKYRRSILMSSLIGSAIRSLWECGKNRHVGGGDLRKVRLFDSEHVERIATVETKIGFNTDSLKIALYDQDHPMFLPYPTGGWPPASGSV